LNVSGCTALTSLDCENNKINSEIPSWRYQLSRFSHDVKYRYWSEQIDGKWVKKHEANPYGWWYPGEPEKGYHGPY